MLIYGSLASDGAIVDKLCIEKRWLKFPTHAENTETFNLELMVFTVDISEKAV
jgi:hypothetical protein